MDKVVAYKTKNKKLFEGLEDAIEDEGGSDIENLIYEDLKYCGSKCPEIEHALKWFLTRPNDFEKVKELMNKYHEKLLKV